MITLTGARDRIGEMLAVGGPVVAILLALSIVALAIILAKVWQFHMLRLGDRRTPEQAIRHLAAGQPDAAIGIAGRSPNPVAQVLAIVLRGQRDGANEQTIREEAQRCGNDRLQEVRAWLRPLEVIASLAPLLGLFGTVLGMIDAFQQLSEAGNQVDPSILSGGIWEALLTTAVGLAVAIPVVAVLAWLESRADAAAQAMESAVTRLFTLELNRQPDGKAGHESDRSHAAAVFDPA